MKHTDDQPARAEIFQSGSDLEWNAAPHPSLDWKVKNPAKGVAIMRFPHLAQIGHSI